MIRFTILSFIACLLVGCFNSKSSSSDKVQLLYSGKAFAAWNEDTVNSYQILLGEGKSFSYTITKKEGAETENLYYKGTITFSKDTIFLNYHKNKKPAELADYLLIEASRKYLIQTFQNTTRRMFLRIQRFRHTI